MRLVDGATPQPLQDMSPLHPLEHQEDVTLLMVLHRAHILEVPHLARLRLPYQPVKRDTRTVSTTNHVLWVARSQSCQHQWIFTARITRLWNLFTVTTPDA
ncbi:hypothetical protein E2C01_086791 [Portunus trituberculatus]|uniref:Uncharacterized protein n=1 Tax=Portunus trituberculatus TaxID=210409 RepID=A0A5B7JAP3_PORTR|nr:hypothetical protein [Portunus trituberculatus]